MGLDTSHDCWHGPYSQFMRWREAIAEVSGFPPLLIMEGFWPPPSGEPTEERFLPLGRSWARNSQIIAMWRQGLLPMKWEYLGDHCKDDRLLPLLTHSDCDGEIPPEQCGPIADALGELLPRLETRPDPELRFDGDNPSRTKTARGVYDGMFRATERFIAGLRLAQENNEPVEFR